MEQRWKGEAMSILIKDIDLPKDDKPLNLEIYSDGHIWINWGPEYERKDNVAIQIDRPHGRIVDIRKIRMYPIPGTADTCYDAPTILEAEE